MITKKPEEHKHSFKLVTKKVLLHDERELASGESPVGGPTVGYDKLTQRVCKCGKTETVDLTRVVA